MEQKNIIGVMKLLKRNIVPVYVFSSMRSGSTLLKSLLATAPDISHLPEVNFQKYGKWNSWKIKLLSDRRIIILKQPAAYHHKSYPRYIEIRGLKKIVLVRDVYETVLSLMHMNAVTNPKKSKEWTMDKLVNDYWYMTCINILEKFDHTNSILVKYEDLISDPIRTTRDVFSFLGSTQKDGVDRYSQSEDFSWEWGTDDGSAKIKTLKVQRTKALDTNLELIDIIRSSDKVLALRSKLGYDRIF